MTQRGQASDRLWLLLAAAYPAVFVNLGHGHNGFLTAALMGGGLVLLDRRPWLAGILFGLLGLQAAVRPDDPAGAGADRTLAHGRRGRRRRSRRSPSSPRSLSASMSGRRSSPAPASPASWCSRRARPAGTRSRASSPWVRMWGGSVPLAYAVQVAASVVVAAALAWLWRSRADFALKAAALADRLDSADALQPRLRPDGAGAEHRFPRRCMDCDTDFLLTRRARSLSCGWCR